MIATGDIQLEQWIAKKGYLPKFLREKDATHTLGEMFFCVFEGNTDRDNPLNHYARYVVSDYIFNTFLPMMGRYGLVLRKISSKTKVDFLDLEKSFNIVNQYMAASVADEDLLEQAFPSQYSRSIDVYREKLKYLPEFWLDFHNRKDIFLLFQDIYSANFTKDDNQQKLNQRDAHIIIVDFFLWYLAKYGYKIQFSSKRYNFLDMDEAIKEIKDAIAQNFAAMLKRDEKEANQ